MTDSKKKPAAIRYGFIGLGHLGGLLARSLIRGGFAVAVHDLDREAADPLLALGASWAESPAEAAAVSDAVITCLPSASASASAVTGPKGVLNGLAKGGTWIEMSTN
ncbi:MAG: NAD(P)-binding domain-containing protein, partial [Dongiales bacterium]